MMMNLRFLAISVGCVGLLAAAVVADDETHTTAMSYRLVGSGLTWERNGDDQVLADVSKRYPDFFAVVLDPKKTHEPDIRRIRADLEREGRGRERFDALNAVAVAYFELNGRAQAGLEDDASTYLSDSFRATKLLSIPWRAYRDIDDPALRDAILDFYEDIVRGEKKHADETAPRILRLVDSLERKESDAARIERIRALTARLEALQEPR